MTERSDLILNVACDLAADFLYYDRKEDEDLPLGQIEAAIKAGELTADDIVRAFADELTNGLAE